MSELLADMRCKPLEGHATMDAQEVEAHLRQVEGWSFNNGAVEKTFSFADHHHTIAFVNAVAWIAHREDHHPDTTFGYNRCTLRFNTHSVGGISLNDFICAAKVDALNR
jgi:4a-hydroxytetrahydrobiopterin dehydratase